MNYEPNKNHWNVGDIVIHDADEKSTRMLMVVIGYDKDGLCQTRYIDEGTLKRWGGESLENRSAVLHDPARFELKERRWSTT